MADSIHISDIQLFNTEQVPEIATKDYVGRKISDAKAELIKWMFIFWIGQVAATFGFILLFLKK